MNQYAVVVKPKTYTYIHVCGVPPVVYSSPEDHVPSCCVEMMISIFCERVVHARFTHIGRGPKIWSANCDTAPLAAPPPAAQPPLAKTSRIAASIVCGIYLEKLSTYKTCHSFCCLLQLSAAQLPKIYYSSNTEISNLRRPHM